MTPHEGPETPRRLVLVRHCATLLNEARKYQGHENVALSEAGRRMALEMGPDLAARGVAPERVWCSDLRRAWETADLVFPGVEQDRDARLRELDFGGFGGLTHAENLAAHEQVFRRWMLDPDAFPPPGGERLSDLWTRVAAWADALPDRGDVVAVLHVGSLKAVVSWALNRPFTEVIPHHLPIGAVVELVTTGDGWRVVRGWEAGEDLPRFLRPPRRPGGAAWPGAERGGDPG